MNDQNTDQSNVSADPQTSAVCPACSFAPGKTVGLIPGTNNCVVCGKVVDWIPPEPPKVKFSNEFTKQGEDYLSKSEKPTVEEFAKMLKVTPDTLWAWATKNKKDEKGNQTQEPARPHFLKLLNDIKKKGKEVSEKLNEKQELFCQIFSSQTEMFGNGVQSYIEAYGIDVNKPGAYNGARASASDLLTNPNILKRIDELLEVNGLNDQAVDKEMAFVILQKVDLGSKVAAIREYNKLRKRITEKMDVTTDGKALPPIQLVDYGSIKNG